MTRPIDLAPFEQCFMRRPNRFWALQAHKLSWESAHIRISEEESRTANMVEAAGVEPASEIAVSQECPCSVAFRMFSPPSLRTDKMRRKLVR